jgi:hypothetical protein
MPPEALKLLIDIQKALSDIKDFTAGNYCEEKLKAES